MIFTMVLLLSGLGFSNSATAQQIGEKVESSFVCYVNNTYMGKEQIPVEVDGKTYYGCCQGCVGKLKNDRSFRYAKDPYSGKEVDKATAFIVNTNNEKKEVLYFQNEANYKNYRKNARK